MRANFAAALLALLILFAACPAGGAGADKTDPLPDGQLKQQYFSGDPSARRRAIERLPRTPENYDLFVRALETDVNPGVRNAALSALRQYPESAPIILEYFNQLNGWNCATAAWALGKMGYQPALEPLKKTIDDIEKQRFTDRRNRGTADVECLEWSLKAIAQIDPAGSLEVLRRFAVQRSEPPLYPRPILEAALEGLVEAGQPEAAEVFLKILEKKTPVITVQVVTHQGNFGVRVVKDLDRDPPSVNGVVSDMKYRRRYLSEAQQEFLGPVLTASRGLLKLGDERGLRPFLDPLSFDQFEKIIRGGKLPGGSREIPGLESQYVRVAALGITHEDHEIRRKSREVFASSSNDLIQNLLRTAVEKEKRESEPSFSERYKEQQRRSSGAVGTPLFYFLSGSVYLVWILCVLADRILSRNSKREANGRLTGKMRPERLWPAGMLALVAAAAVFTWVYSRYFYAIHSGDMWRPDLLALLLLPSVWYLISRFIYLGRYDGPGKSSIAFQAFLSSVPVIGFVLAFISILLPTGGHPPLFVLVYALSILGVLFAVPLGLGILAVIWSTGKGRGFSALILAHFFALFVIGNPQYIGILNKMVLGDPAGFKMYNLNYSLHSPDKAQIEVAVNSDLPSGTVLKVGCYRVYHLKERTRPSSYILGAAEKPQKGLIFEGFVTLEGNNARIVIPVEDTAWQEDYYATCARDIWGNPFYEIGEIDPDVEVEISFSPSYDHGADAHRSFERRKNAHGFHRMNLQGDGEKRKEPPGGGGINGRWTVIFTKTVQVEDVE